MPGRRLSKVEHQLSEWWQHSERFDFPVLRSLSITGSPGLRGIENISVNFDYPLTAVCGKNGSGKTTILALSVLGFHSPENHFPSGARRRPKAEENYTYYTFRDFFLKGPTDPDIVGVKISWGYGGGDAKTVTIEKSPKKWMRYERRPQRPVHYLGVIRSIPAVEQSVIRSRFGTRSIEFKPEPLNDDFRKRLSDIMGRPYDAAEIIFSARHSISSCTSGGTYSSFNMGAGEDILIELLYISQECPNGSLIVVEEIELGLHPEALIRLAEHLQEVVFKKKLQVIVSTHSQHFIDSIPRQARILIQRAERAHTAISGPTTRFAIGIMAGKAEPELKIYCEDNFAQHIIEQSLPLNLRKRSEVFPIGSKTELAKQAAYHLKARHREKVLLV